MKTLCFTELESGREKGHPFVATDTVHGGVRLDSGIHLLVAPNGFGKTTFLQTLAGVLKPLSGRMELDGRPYQPESDTLYMSEYLSFPKYVYPEEWVEAVSGGRIDDRLLAAVHGLRMEPQLRRFLGRMSQGERRKVTWLAAISSKKPVLLLDEPFDGLDILAIDHALELLVRMRKEGKIVVVTAHQISEIAQVCDQVLAIADRQLMPLEVRGEKPLRERVLELYRGKV